ncbi:MAG TPA: M1 family metallopeptidase [Vicinamibacterales bacterium]
MKKLLLACGVFLVLTTSAAAQRLSGAVVPDHYTLWFAPDLQKDTFKGRETIRVQLKVPASSITLHAAEIDFDEVRIEAGGREQPARVTLDEKAETATLTVPEEMPAGPAAIHISYTGILNDKLRGFYRSEANGRKYAVTQMEATDARRAFPSFDEPIYKATFEISLTIASGDTAISNGAQVSDTPGPEPGTHTLRFARTRKMSTYLVAMIVGDFACREGAADGTPLRICSTPDKRALTGFALESARQQLEYFNAYFGIRYPFDKLDIVAIPDFAAGAMENVGAITFRERLLLVDPERASLGVRKQVASILAHEIAHMWFGNLVTMKWWDDIWLNEGFATWAETKPVAAWRPEWNVHLDEASATQSALGLDALRSTRPIRTKVETPEEINEVFDAIAYEKSAAVLRMLEGFVGEEGFRKGVSAYLTKHAFGNAAGEDFWTEMTAVTGRPIDRIMQSFVEQPGAPVVSVRTTCTGTTGEIMLRQERFVAAPGAEGLQQSWTMPVCFKAADGQPRCEVIARREHTVAAPSCNNVFANAKNRGYYFSEYTPDGVRSLSRVAAGLEPVERLGLLGDEWWMVRGGRHDVGVYLDLAASLSNDETAAVTDAIAGRLEFADAYLVRQPERARYEGWVRRRFGPTLRGMGIPGDPRDPDERQSRRATLIQLLGVAGNDAEMQRRARALAEGYIARPASLSGTLAPAVLRVAALAGDAMLYGQYVAQVHKLAAQPEEYYRFFNALPWFRDPALIRRTLAFAISPVVRTQDTGTLIANAIARPWSQDSAWEFTKAQWPTLVQKLGTFQGIPTIISSLGSMCSTEKAAEVRQFFAKNPVPSSGRTLRQAIERIETCAALAERQSGPMAAWLRTAR